MEITESPDIIRSGRPVEGLDLLNQFNQLAPESPLSAEILQTQGWVEFFSLRLYETNGAAHNEHLKLALERIRQETPVPGDWEIVRAKYDALAADRFEHSRVHALLKRKTPQRIAADAQLDRTK